MTDNGTKVTVAGNIESTGFFQTSSRAVKTNIVNFDKNALDIINQTQIVSFSYKNDPDRKHIGFIAEDTPVELSTVKQNTMDTSSTVAVLLKAIQELEARVKALENEVR
jgi:hypothetical protein